MIVDEFARLVEVYGSNWRRWPEPERQDAQALLTRSRDAQAAWNKARELEEVLDRLQSEPAGDWLKAHIISLADTVPQDFDDHTEGIDTRFFRTRWTQVAVLAGAFVLGLVLSLNGLSIVPRSETRVDMSYLVQDSSPVEGWMP